MFKREKALGLVVVTTVATMLASSVAASAAPPQPGAPPTDRYTLPARPNPGHASKLGPGQGGVMWFTDINNAVVGRVTPGGAFREFPVSDPNEFLRGITAGPDGNMWFAEEGRCIDDDCTDFTDGKIGQITPNGQITEFPVPTANGHPWEITDGPDGNLWFTEIGDNLHHFPGSVEVIEGNKIGRITPKGQITEFPVPTFDSFPDGITTGPDGALWFTENSGNKVGRITTSGQFSEFAIPTQGSAPIGIRTGLDSNLWFTEQLGQRIGRVTPQGEVTEFPLPNAGNPVWITLGPDGAMWFDEVRGQRIGRITSDGTITELSLPAGTYPNPIATGSGSMDIWFGEPFNHVVDKMSVCRDPQFRAACARAAPVLRSSRSL